MRVMEITKIQTEVDTAREREREGGEWPKKRQRKGADGDKGMLGTKCSNPKPTSKRVTQGFHIVSVSGRGPLS